MKIIVSLLLLSAPGAALAQAKATDMQVDVVAASRSEAAYNQAEEVLWRQHRLLDIQDTVNEKRKALEAKSAADDDVLARLPVPVAMPTGAAGAAGGALPSAAPGPAAPALPFRLASIWGVEGKYQVFIQTNGMRQLVTLGSQLPGGWSLVGIEASSIRIRKGAVVKSVALGE